MGTVIPLIISDSTNEPIPHFPLWLVPLAGRSKVDL